MISVFISYRRSDSTPYAASLATALRQALGTTNVFLDTVGIAIGQPFPDRLLKELSAARACLVVIGPDWLRSSDEHSRRRIDNPDDWVHREVKFAVEHGIAVPVLVGGAVIPSAAALPEPLRGLATANAFALRDDRLLQDLKTLIDELCGRFELPLVEPEIKWPTPDKEVRALNELELSTWIASRRPLDSAGTRAAKSRWEDVAWKKGGKVQDGRALRRAYEFPSFEDAIHFIATAARFVTRTEHHPAWENVWRTVIVHLTTFDIGHRPSVFDLRLAEYLDDLYREYTTPLPALPGPPSGPALSAG
jgi:pterin-4a-carbinolamine dehydratase